MLNITFEFVGGPNDGKVVQGKLGEPSDAERHYLFSHRGRVGQRFAVASDYAIEYLADKGKAIEDPVQRHHYVVTDRLEEGDDVWVRAEYSPDDDGKFPGPVDEETAPAINLDGQLLVASPRMDDPLFQQAVVLVVDQSDDQTFGVMLNRPTPETVGQLWKEVSEIPCESGRAVFVGGPEDGPVAVLHTDESAADVPLLPGVFLSVEKNNLEWIVQQQDVEQRLFIGTADWDAEQLEEELANGDWLILPATQDLVFADPEDQWRQALQKLGRTFFQSIGVKHIPDDPRVN